MLHSMKCLKQALLQTLFTACLLLALPLAQAQSEQEHAHLQVNVAVAPGFLGSKGDVMGIYAIEMIPCLKATAYLEPVRPHRNGLHAVADAATDLFVSPAWANHREKFDGPSSKEVRQRVPLDQSQDVDIGELPVALGTYCQVRLTLARLPSVAQPVSLPALPYSFRMARPGSLPPLELNYAHPFIIALKKPWIANGKVSNLKITLYPLLVQPLLADTSLDAGTLSQKVLTLLAKRAKAVVTVKKPE
jgi:hypothetical protein